MFQQHAFVFCCCIFVSTFGTAFFAPYRRFKYILPKCFACISSKHFFIVYRKGVFQQTRFLFLLSHIRQHLYRIFCTVQAFYVHFARTFFIVYRKKACFDKHAFVFCCAYPSALTVPYFLHRTGVLRTFCPNLHCFPVEKACRFTTRFIYYFCRQRKLYTVLPSGGNPSYLKAFFCKTFPLFVQCQIIMVREMRFFCKSTPSTFTSTTSPTFTTSNGCLTNFLAES